MADPAVQRLNVDEFFGWCREDDKWRWELIDGRATAVLPMTQAQDTIVSNLLDRIAEALRLDGDHVVGLQAGVVVEDRTDACYRPDIAVGLGYDSARHEIMQPVLIVQVVSEETAWVKHEVKFHDYRSMSTIREIVVIDDEYMHCEIQYPHSAHSWSSRLLVAPDDRLKLDTIGLDVPLSEIYTGVSLRDRWEDHRQRRETALAEAATRRFTLEEFYEWYPEDVAHWELIDGRAVMRERAPRAHNILVASVVSRIDQALDSRPGLAAGVHGGIRPLHRSDTYYEADAVVAGASLTPDQVEFPEPILIAEVLSPETEVKDRTRKLPDYKAMPSLQEILLIDSTRMHAEVYRRRGAEHWDRTEVSSADARLRLESVGLDMPLGMLYAKVPLELGSGIARPKP